MNAMVSNDEMDIMRNDDGYENLLANIRKEFLKNVREGEEPLFRTDASGLYDLLLANIPEEARQHYNCNACRHFVNHFGGLVRIDEKTGGQYPVMWSTRVPDFFAEAVKAIRDKVKNAKVTGVFVSSEAELGISQTGVWTHMAVDMPAKLIYKGRIKNASQEAAEKLEDYRMLTAAAGRYKVETVEAAVNLLRSESLYRSEKVLGVAEWFLKVLRDTKGKKKSSNIMWRKVAEAPAGFCHVSSSMIGTLLDDIEAGYDFESVKRKFAEKMNPLQYQRPQAAPAMGNVVQAEKIVAKLGIENSLKRRFARLDELKTVWKPSPERDTTVASGVFAGIKTKGNIGHNMAQAANLAINRNAVAITWEKFRRTVLPTAKRIKFWVSGSSDNYAALVTAEDMSAPPILQWDTEDERNPFSWYVYAGGSVPSRWNLSSGFVDVTGVVLQPSMWNEAVHNHGMSVFFILKGAKDNLPQGTGSALFPECLKSELREVRATIEAYSRTHDLGDAEEASACGIRFQAGSNRSVLLRVASDVGITEYRIDRWD